MAVIFLFLLNFETLSIAPMCFLDINKVNTAIIMAIGYQPRIRVMIIPAKDIYWWIFWLKRDLEICPPSKTATGIRLSMVMIIPTHPANKTELIIMSYPWGATGAAKRDIKYIKGEGIN